MMKIGKRFECLRLNEKLPGAVYWSAPELISISDISRVNEDGERYTPSTYSDIYSYGCIMYEVLSGDAPWRHIIARAVYTTILDGETPQASHNIPKEDWVFILQCWLSLPSLRPPASQALKFTRTRISAFPDHVEFRKMSSRASIYSVHLDGANVYNLSSLLHSHPQPAFSDLATCWESIDKLANALIDLPTTGRCWHRGLIDAIQLYHVSFTMLQPSSAFITSSLLSAMIAQVSTKQNDVVTLDAAERIIGHFGSDNPFHFTAFSCLSLHGIAEHMINKDQHIASRVKHWYRECFNSPAGDTLCRLQIALACARITEEIGDADFSLEAYEAALRLLQLYISATHPTSWAEPVEHISASLAADAAAAALRLGEPDVSKAVELLEWGRELLRAYIVRSHAREVGEKQIPDCEPCERPSFSRLLEATEGGPAIMLIASKHSCHAIIVSKALSKPHHILLQVTLDSLTELSTSFQEYISSASNNSDSVEEQLKAILRSLWVNVVAPVVHHPSLENVPCNSRIWWCLTSVFSTLPIHAAGEYTSEGEQLSRFYVSSYTSSITSLLRARSWTGQSKESFSDFATIYQARPFPNDEQEEVEYPVIKSAEVEPDMVISNLPPSIFLKRFPDATKEDANEALEKYGWFHLMAYATQNAYQPLDSSFLMRGGSLSISDILQANLGPKEFAFLSPRPVGSRFSWMQNEIVHFATGLQISGFKSVVGMMGNVDDLNIIEKFYSAFFRGNGPPDCTRAARALHDALEKIANSKAGLPLGQRVAFAHFGV
ncbi:hypothetical protein M405DRAFT_938423 [Rhizopogon salebrosus TDB-379]|nr:hypothetical protein M405DRAFT_938423 [Rhizopogon salebrosus TDB-379]